VDKLGDIKLFVKIVQLNGLASAGRELGLSPASVTARLNRLEAGYGVRLLNRTTRRIALTEEGRTFYTSCLRIISDIDEAEDRLRTEKAELSGQIKVSATFDLGRQTIAPLLSEFTRKHSKVTLQLHYADQLVDLLAGEFDLAIRYGSLPDSSLVARKLAPNRRILCASPGYIARRGNPLNPNDLAEHECLSLMREQQGQIHWHFSRKGQQASVQINPRLQSNDGAQLRLWALEGLGIALKSFWDIKVDLEAGHLVPVLQQYQHDWGVLNADGLADLYVVYPSREYLPKRTSHLIEVLASHFSEQMASNNDSQNLLSMIR